MKRKLLLLVILVGCLVVTGCGSNGGSGSNSYITYYKDSKIISKLEQKEFEGIKYKEVTWQENGDLHVTLIVYNDSDKNYIIDGSIQGYKGSNKNNQVAQSDTQTVLAHSAYPLSFTLFEADSYKIERLKINGEDDDAIKVDDYKFDSYKKDEEKARLYLYYIFNGNKTNNTEVEILGTKDGKVVGKFSTFMYVADEDGDESDDDPSKSGEKCVAKYGSPKTIDFSKYDGFIYFYEGYYD